MSLCLLILCKLLFLLRLWETMTPEILPLTLMHFALVCRSRDPWLSGPRAKQSHQVPSRAAHSLSDINHPSNALLTKGVCELNSLLRQDPRRDLYAPKTHGVTLSAPRAVCMCLCSGQWLWIQLLSSSCWPPASQTDSGTAIFLQSSPSPWRFLYEQANVAPEGKVQTVLC